MELPLAEDGAGRLADLVEGGAFEMRRLPHREGGGVRDGGRADEGGAVAEGLEDAGVEVGGEARVVDGGVRVGGRGAVDFGGEGCRQGVGAGGGGVEGEGHVRGEGVDLVVLGDDFGGRELLSGLGCGSHGWSDGEGGEGEGEEEEE